MASSQSNDQSRPQSPEGSYGTQQPSTPGRGHIYSDLGEAHRRIAGRQTPASNASESKSKLKQNRKGSLEILGIPRSRDNQTESSQSENVGPVNSPTSIYGRSLMNAPRLPTLPAISSFNMPSVGGDSAITTQNYTKHTTDFQVKEHFEEEEEEWNRQKGRRLPTGLLSSKPPQSPLPALPLSRRRSRSMIDYGSSSIPNASTVSDSQQLLRTDTQAGQPHESRQEFSPSPLRLPPKHGLKKWETRDDFYSEVGSSHGDVTNESSDDPFKYDTGNYKTTFQNTKEREVSRALKRMSKIGGLSEATFVTPEGSPAGKNPSHNIRIAIQRPHQLPSRETNISNKDSGIAHENSLDTQRDSAWVTEADSELDDISDILDNPIGIKQAGSSVVCCSEDDREKRPGTFASRFRTLQHPAGPESYELHDLKGTKQSVMLPKTRFQGTGGYPNNSTRFFSDNVKTNQDANKMPRNLTGKLTNPFGQRSSYRRADFEGNFTTRANRDGTKYEFRESISEYPTTQAESPGLQPSGSHGSLVGAGLELRRPSKRLREDLASKTPNSTSSNCSQVTTSSSKTAKANSKKLWKPRLVDQAYPIRNGRWWEAERDYAGQLPSPTLASFNGEPITSDAKFQFQLLSLTDAQRKNKEQRESGETDETEPAHIRYQRAMSHSSSRGQALSSPIEVPRPVYDRRRPVGVAPHLSFDFSPSSCGSFKEAFLGKFQKVFSRYIPRFLTRSRYAVSILGHEPQRGYANIDSSGQTSFTLWTCTYGLWHRHHRHGGPSILLEPDSHPAPSTGCWEWNE